SFDELFESLNTIYSKTKDSIILDKCASIYSFLIGHSNLKDENSNENQDQYDNSSLVNINEIGKRHFSTLLNEIFLKQITLSIDTINEMLNADNLEENALTFFESLNYGIKRIVCLLKQIDLQLFKDLIPDYSRTFNQSISISETLLKKRSIILKKLDKNNDDESTHVITIDDDDKKDNMDVDGVVNGEKKDKRFNEIEHLIQDIIDNSMTGLYLDINWNGIKLEELKTNEENRKKEKELEDDIANELEKEMDEDEEEEKEKEKEKKDDDDEEEEEEKEEKEKDEDEEGEKEEEKEESDKETEKKNETEKEKDKEMDVDDEDEPKEKSESDKEKDEKEVDDDEKEKEKKEEEASKENESDKEADKETDEAAATATKKKSDYEKECDRIKEKIENFIFGNQKILNKNNRKFWTWRSRYAAYHKLADMYLLCNKKFDEVITTDYLKIPTYSIQREMVTVINECLESVFEVILNKAQEDYIEDDCLNRKDYSKLVIYSIIGYQLSSLVTPLQKLVLSGIVGLEHVSNILQWIEFVNYYVESSENMDDAELSASNLTENEINIINNYWNVTCQKIVDEILNKYPKSLIENETQNAANLTKTSSDDQEEIQKATKAATSIIIKVRTVIDKLLEELARQSIMK
ncbi:hypothetical protein PIROE2DRAFT_4296, partial [Piromyces sp. E2]